MKTRKHKCPVCKRKMPRGSNFCGTCGAKLSKYCNCGVLHKKYDCGHAECPGFSLLVELAEKAQVN